MNFLLLRFIIFLNLLALLLLMAFMPWPANAAPLCEQRTAAHIAEHGGLAADSAWHLANGDLPTCGGQEQTRSNDRTGVEETRRGGGSDQSGPKWNDDDEPKSRYCRKHFFC